MLKLEFMDQRQPGIWLVESEFRIGSEGRNHLVLADEGVSDNHAVIRLEDGHAYLSDLKSFKGTSVNGQKITERFQLRAGDHVAIGSVEFELVESQSSNARNVGAKVKSDWTLMALSGEHKGRTFPMNGVITIGRSANCEIVINNEHLSRRHAELNLKNGLLRIIDLNSSNGTKVNGVKITDQPLKPGDKISFEDVVFLVTGPAVDLSSLPEEDDEATVFRTIAPMPKAPPKPRPAAPKATASAAAVETQVSAPEPKSSMLPMVVGGILVLALVIIGLVMSGVV